MIRPIPVVLAAPHPLFLAGIRSLFDGQREFVVLAACASYHPTLRALKRHQPLVLVADAALCDDDLTGFERFHVVAPGTRVVVIAHQSPPRPLAALASLAVQALLPRDISPERLVQCVKALAEGRSCAGAIVRSLVKPTAGTPRSRHQLAALTLRERQIAQGVARGKRNKEIAAAFGITPGTVKLHLHRIYTKLGVNGRLALYKRLAEEQEEGGHPEP